MVGATATELDRIASEEVSQRLDNLSDKDVKELITLSRRMASIQGKAFHKRKDDG
jgi:hypothetical protein